MTKKVGIGSYGGVLQKACFLGTARKVLDK